LKCWLLKVIQYLWTTCITQQNFCAKVYFILEYRELICKYVCMCVQCFSAGMCGCACQLTCQRSVSSFTSASAFSTSILMLEQVRVLVKMFL
jgi:hypothetical protein